MANSKACTLKITSNVINLGEDGHPEGEIEKDEFTAQGFIKTDCGITELSYKEAREGAKILCEVKVKNGSIEVKRRGDVVCDMVFVAEKTHKPVYRVPPFSFDMEILTSRVESTIENVGGAISLFYTMKIGGAEKRCRMKISRID